jgi:hypothetical protein
LINIIKFLILFVVLLLYFIFVQKNSKPTTYKLLKKKNPRIRGRQLQWQGSISRTHPHHPTALDEINAVIEQIIRCRNKHTFLF